MSYNKSKNSLIKVLHIITGLNRGGAETALFRLVSRKNYGSEFEHQVICLLGDGYYYKKLKALGIHVDLLQLSSVFNLPRAIFKLIKLVRWSNADIVQTWLYHSDFLGGCVAKLFSHVPIVWGVHTVSLDPSSSKMTKLVRKLCAMLSRWVPDKIIFVAKSSADYHVKLGYTNTKIEIVPNGFESMLVESQEQISKNFRRDLGIGDSELVIGSIGRFHPDKDYINLFKAARILINKKIKIKLLLIGPDLQSSNAVLMGWALELGLKECLVALGPRDDVSTCFHAMDIFCLHSRTEAFPLVLGEAMAASRAIVATDVGDVKYILGDAGLVVPHSDSECLAEALDNMIKLTSRARESYGVAARDRVISEFSIDKTQFKIYSIYKKLSRQGS